ncbi:clavesin-1-like isoform X2 [Macrosteles quadrilineatus]|nr:clavesin-1-like isoform X2 [Macrosteles quadrilineatus]XP_054269040.1 clavesin-1-like isoform X2 [Macrosteles quadrilineatus]
MAEYCDFDWTGYRVPISPSSAPYTPTKEVPLGKEEALKVLKSKVDSNKELPEMTDMFLLRFLHARKMKVEESYHLLCRYHQYRKENPALFANMNLNDTLIQQALYDGFPGVLANRDRRGRCVLVFFCNHWDHSNYSLEVIYRSLLLTLDRLLEQEENQINGFVFIVDWTDFSLRQSTNISPRVLKSMVEGLQDCFPARFKGVHFVNQPWYIEAALMVVKPFLKEKTKEKIWMYGNNLSALHEAVNADLLPAELGGELPTHKPASWADYMLTSDASSRWKEKDIGKVYPDEN